jgi:glycosyltransferase involved in cell wall biosynthesis
MPSQAWLARQIAGIRGFETLVVCWHDARDPARAAAEGWRVERLAHPFGPSGAWDRRLGRLRRLALGNVCATAGAERRALDRLAARARPDAILCHFGGTALRLLPVAEALGVPLVAHYHGRDLSYQLSDTWYRRSLVRHLPRIAAHVAVGAHQRRWLIAAGAPPERVHLVPCGAPVSAFRPAPLPEGGPRFLLIGRLTRQKGVHVAIEALARALPDLPGAELRVVGAAPEALRRPLEALARRRGVAGRVAFAGPVPPEAIEGELAAASALLHPALDIDGEREGFGVAVTEAAAMERPVIVSDSGGLPDQVIDGETGVLCPQGDAGAVAEAMVRLGRDRALAERMGRAGRRNALEHFDTERQVERLEALLRAAIAGGVSGARG